MSLVSNPPHRFDPVEIEWEEGAPKARLEVSEDDTKGALSHDDLFGWTCNPYRGCTHACAYCYARRYHEYLGLGAGTDFERKLVVKRRAPDLLAEAFAAPSWKGEPVSFSGVTDCYQPLERRYRLTRACLEVAADHRNPVTILTRSGLVTRDLDVLRRLHAHGAVAVTFSVPVVDAELQRAIEPGAPSPAVRFAAMRTLADAGIPVGVSLAPIVPGLSDSGIPETLERAREAGARWAWRDLVRLPGSVAVVFEERLREALPHRADGVLAKIRRLHGGELDDPRFGSQIPELETDASWQLVEQMFRVWTKRLGYGESWRAPEPSPFRRPSRQLGLWG